MLLESKIGNWRYLPVKWTQIPKYDEDEPRAICTETSNHSFLALDNKKVELLEEKESDCQKWTRSKAVNGYFALKTDNNTKFLTVGDHLDLTISGKSQILY